MVPFDVQIEGGSGSFSMAENRNANGQLVNDSTFDGDSPVGSGSGTHTP
jgi:hypothetical protein